MITINYAHLVFPHPLLTSNPPIIHFVVTNLTSPLPIIFYLSDLFIAYISRGMGEIAQGNHITGVLGVWQKLLASKVRSFFYYIF